MHSSSLNTSKYAAGVIFFLFAIAWQQSLAVEVMQISKESDYARLQQRGVRIQSGLSYKLQMEVIGAYRPTNTDHFPEFCAGCIDPQFTSYEADFDGSITRIEGLFVSHFEGDYTFSLSLFSVPTLLVKSVELVEVSSGINLIKNSDFTAGNRHWSMDGGEMSVLDVEIPKPVTLDFTEVTYRAFDGREYKLNAIEGESVVLLIPLNGNYNQDIIYQILSSLDDGWQYFQYVMGQDPLYNGNNVFIDNTQVTNKPTLAAVASTCGAGCGWIGATGIEIGNGTWEETYFNAVNKMETRGVFQYEMGRNFWLFGHQLQAADWDPYHLATAFATIFGFKAGVAGGSTQESGNSLVDWVATYEAAFLDYLNAPDWALLKNGGQKGEKIHGGLWIYMENQYGDAFLPRFFREVSKMPSSKTLTDATTNYAIAASKASGRNLKDFFESSLLFPIDGIRFDTEVGGLTEPNTRPLALGREAAVSVEKNKSVEISLRGFDADGDELAYSISRNPQNGTARLNGNKVTYSPKADYLGNDYFDFRVYDGVTYSTSARINISVEDQSEEIGGTLILSNIGLNQILDKQGNPASSTVRVAVFDTSNVQISSTYSVLGAGYFSAGTVVINNLFGRIDFRIGAWDVFEPSNIGYSGTMSLMLGGTGSPPTLPVSLPTDFSGVRIPDGNNPPTASPATYSTLRDQSVDVQLKANDLDGDVLIYEILTLPSHGVLTGVPPILQYTPRLGYLGEDVFSFKANDGTDDSPAAEVRLSVRAKSDATGGTLVLSNIGLSVILDSQGLPAGDDTRLAVFDSNKNRLTDAFPVLGAGYFSAGTVTLIGVEGTVGLHIGAWNASSPALVGYSDPFNITLGGQGNPPSVPATLPQSFSGVRIPEAGTLVLSNIGLAQVFDRDGNPAGADVRVALFSDEGHQLSSAYPILGVGYFAPGIIGIPVPEGTREPWLQVGAWHQDDPSIVGFSDLFRIRLGGDGTPPALPGRLPADFSGIRILADPAPLFIQQPEDMFLTLGDSFTLSVSVDLAEGVSFNWYKDGKPIRGATGSFLEVLRANPSDSGAYSCIATGKNGLSSQSRIASVRVLPRPRFDRVAGSKGINLVVSAVADTQARILSTEDFTQWTLEVAIDVAEDGDFSFEVDHQSGAPSRFFVVEYGPPALNL